MINSAAYFQRTVDRIIYDENLVGTYPHIDNITVCGMKKEDHDKNLADFPNAANKYGFTLDEEKSTIGVKELKLLGYEVSYEWTKPDPESTTSQRTSLHKDPKPQHRVVPLASCS